MAHPPWTPDEPALERYARTHVAYEARTLRGQIEAAGRLGGRLRDARELALMEAALVHLRLLDDFVGSPPVGDDVSATHYLSTWKLQQFLEADERDRINAQVAHLAARRQRPRYSVHALGRRCGLALLDLEAALVADPTASHRAAYLEEAFGHARVLAGDRSSATYSTSETTIFTTWTVPPSA